MKHVNSADSAERIRLMGHRAYVGGTDSESWYSIGRLQYHFLVAEGLLPSHSFLDVACGSLRLGQFLIPYLERRNYHGLDAEKDLIQAGLSKELDSRVLEQRCPTFFVCDDFSFPWEFTVKNGKIAPNDDVFAGSFLPRIDIAMAQSLITHLTPEDIYLFLSGMGRVMAENGRLYTTFFLGDSGKNPRESHPNLAFFYSESEIKNMFLDHGFTVDSIKEWNHPRGQLMISSHYNAPVIIDYSSTIRGMR